MLTISDSTLKNNFAIRDAVFRVSSYSSISLSDTLITKNTAEVFNSIGSIIRISS